MCGLKTLMAVDKPAKIYVARHRGMVGSAILQDLQHGILGSMDRQGLQPRDDEEFPVIKTVPRFFPPHRSQNSARITYQNQRTTWLGAGFMLDDMVQKMVAIDLADAKKDALFKQHGFSVKVSVE